MLEQWRKSALRKARDCGPGRSVQKPSVEFSRAASRREMASSSVADARHVWQLRCENRIQWIALTADCVDGIGKSAVGAVMAGKDIVQRNVCLEVTIVSLIRTLSNEYEDPTEIGTHDRILHDLVGSSSKPWVELSRAHQLAVGNEVSRRSSRPRRTG